MKMKDLTWDEKFVWIFVQLVRMLSSIIILGCMSVSVILLAVSYAIRIEHGYLSLGFACFATTIIVLSIRALIETWKLH